jgi:hypothetical protein
MIALCTQLLYSNDTEEKEEEGKKEESLLLLTALQRYHTLVEGEGLGRCEWGKRHSPGCPRKRALKRKFGTDITESTVNSANGASAAILGGSRTHHRCSKCLVWLCVEGPCWRQYHHSNGVNC